MRMRFGQGKMGLERTSMEEDVKKHDHRSPGDAPSMEEDVKKHDHRSPGDAPVLASGVHPRS
jgi:hypothetical protein